MYKKLKLYKNEKGQSMVEFALVLPILLFVILGMLEFGWIFNAKITITSAAREGARIAIVTNIDHEDRALEAVINALSNTDINNIQVEYIPYNPSESVNNIRNIKVIASGEIEPLIGLFVSGPFELKADATMRLE